MAFEFDVAETRSGRSFSLDGKGDEITIAWEKNFRVKVTATEGDSLDDVSEFDLVTADGIPKINKSIYESGGKILPFVICRNVKADRDAKNKSLWYVKTKYRGVGASGEITFLEPIDPPDNVTDITPKIVEKFGEVERVLYQDYTSPTPKPIVTPLKRFFAEPVVERVPTLTLQISKYESTVSYQTLLDRMLRMNSTTYRGKPAHTWLVENIEPTDVEVTITGPGPGETQQVEATLVTYTVTYNPLDDGWLDTRALIDTHYISGGKVLPFLDGELKTQRLGFITSTGAIKAGTTPDYETFIQQKTTDLNTFLPGA